MCTDVFALIISAVTNLLKSNFKCDYLTGLIEIQKMIIYMSTMIHEQNGKNHFSLGSLKV